MTNNPYDKKYNSKEYYWGLKPSSICRKFMELTENKKDHPLVVDLGCGEGRDAVALAKAGFNVTAVDLSQGGLDKTKVLAKKEKVEITTSLFDITNDMLDKTYNHVISSGTLHYIPVEERIERIRYFKKMTATDGLNAHTVLISKPFIDPPPDNQPEATLFKSGELMSYYHDWEIIYTDETIFNCNSGGLPHQHCANRIIARKPSA